MKEYHKGLLDLGMNFLLATYVGILLVVYEKEQSNFLLSVLFLTSAVILLGIYKYFYNHFEKK